MTMHRKWVCKLIGLKKLEGNQGQSLTQASLADEDGYVYRPNIDVATEMVNMMQASRSFQNSIEAINTAKQLAMRTLTLGK